MKNMTSLTNILRGVSAFLSLSRYRLVNESLSSRLRLVAIFCLLMTGGVGNVLGDSYTFPAGTTIYYDFTAITGGGNYNTATFKNTSDYQTYDGSLGGKVIVVTFASAKQIYTDQYLFKTGTGNWTDVAFKVPDAGQNMVICGADGKSFTWGTTRTFKSGKKIYFKDYSSNMSTLGGGTHWKNSDGNVYAKFYDGSSWTYSTYGNLVSGSWNGNNAVYEITVPGSGKTYTKVVFTRGTAGTDAGTWNTTTEQMADLGRNMFTIKDAKDGGNWIGSWSKYGTPNGALLGEFNDWDPCEGLFSGGDPNRIIVTLEANTTYRFTILQESTYWACTTCNHITNTNLDHQTYSGQNDLVIETAEAGEYCFHWDKTNHRVSIYYPQARLTKNTYIYFDARNSDNSHWNVLSPIAGRFYFKYYDSGGDQSNASVNTPLETSVLYTTVPNNDWIGQVQINRLSSDMGTQYNDKTSLLSASDRVDTKQNCIVIPAGQSAQWSPTVQWGYYCPPTTSETFTDNNTDKISWQPNSNDGSTSSKAILVKTGTTLKVTASASKAVADGNMTVKYDFQVNSGSVSANTTGTYTSTASTNNTVYNVKMQAYTNYNLDNTKNSTKSSTKNLYYKALNTYSVTHTMTNVTRSDGRFGADAAAYHLAYSATYAAQDGYVLPSSITVKFGSTTKTSGTDYTWNSSTGVLNIPADKIDGDVTVIISGTPRWYVCGSTSAMGNWAYPGTLAIENYTTSAGVTTGYIDITLEARTEYEFKMYDLGAGEVKWVGCNPEMTSSINYSNSGTAYALNTYPGYNFKFRSAGAGSYQFTRDITNNTVTITYPAALSVTYDDNGSTGGSLPATDYYNSGETVTVASNSGSLAKTGYDLAGWNTNNDGSGTNYAVGSGTFTISENTNLYAKWTQNVVLDKENGEANGSVTLTYNSSSHAAITNPTKSGCVFDGWYTGDDGTGDLVIDIAGNLQANVTNYTDENGKWIWAGTAPTLHAKWYQNYTITWKVNGSTYTAGSPSTTGNARDGFTTMPTNPADNTLSCASSFRGWSETNIGGPSTTTQPADLFRTAADAPTIDEDKIFYAVFGDATDEAYVGTVLWSENWTEESANATPGSPTTGGSVVYGGASISYSYSDGTGGFSTGATKVYNSNDAGGSKPELMVHGNKTTAGYFEITGLRKEGASALTLTFKRTNSNTSALSLTVSGDGYSIAKVSGSGAGTYVYTITCGTAETFTLRFTGHQVSSPTNTRIDDIVIKVKTDGATNFRTLCPSLTLTGPSASNILMTSAAEKTVRSQEAFTISGTALTKNATITGDFGTSALNAKFAFKTAAGADITTDANGDVSATAYVFYTPAVGDVTDGTDIATAITATVSGAGAATSNDLSGTKSVKGRHLPTKFIIAEKVGGSWYALPNNMSNSQTNPTRVKISSVNEGTGVATIYSDVTDYLAWGMGMTGRTEKNYTMEFYSDLVNDAKYLKTHTSSANTIGQYAKQTSTNQQYTEFKPTTSDLVDYTLYNEFQTYYLGINSTVWGVYSSSSTVRFLSIDQHAAPTITWQNDMTSSQFDQNKAENGVVTIPAGTPLSCNEPSGLLTFDGWVTATWSGFKTTGFTKVNEGDVATSNATYYAVFKDANNRYYTQCPTIYSITYTPNGGTGSNYVTYTMNTTADAITVETAGFTKSGSTFVGWTNPDDVEGAVILPGAGRITGLTGNITLNAVWMGTTTITGTVRLTSAAGEKVATGTTDVTISNADFACATALRITYYDVTNDVTYGRSGSPTYTSSEFRLCNASYNVADGTNIDLSAVTGSYNQTFSITYEPTGGANTLDRYRLIVEVLLKNTVIDTKTLDLYGRTLPESFAIAIKVGGSWYALPNNMASAGTYDPVLISVTEDVNVLNWSAQGPSTVGYKMKDYTPNYSKLRFAADDTNEYCLWASTGNAAEIRNWSASSTDANYAWTVTPDANFNAYTMANLANTREALKIYNLKWEMYNTGGFSAIHFIPLTTVTPIDVTVMEWGVNEIAVKTVASWNPSAITAQISGGSATTVTKTAIGGDLYKLTGVGDLKGNPGEPLALNITDGGAKQAIIQIPFIVTDTKTEADLAGLMDASTLAEKRAIAKDIDVIVRSGGTLSSESSASGTFKDLYIYPGGKADFTKDISIQNVYMRGGFSWLGGAYAHPQLNVAAGKSISGIGSTGHGIFYDIYLNSDMYYMFALPKTVSVDDITNEENGDDWFAWIKAYSGEGRTKTPKETGWSYVTSGNIERGAGYEIAIKPRLNRPYGILRFPLLKSTGWSNETDIAPSVTGWGASDPKVSANNKGWNIIGNPYLTAYNNATTPGTTPSGIIQTQTLVEHKPDGEHWDGTYEWSTGNVKYFTVPHYTDFEYDDVRAYPYKLDAFFPFFIQVNGDGTVSFSASNKTLKMPSRMAEETPREVMVDFALTNSNDVKDVAGLTISNQYSADFDMEDKEKTIQNGNASMKVYTMVGEYRTAFNSLPEAVAAQPIPVGYIAPQAGKYEFSLEEGEFAEVEHVWLTDYSESAVVDLLLGDKYEFETEAGAFNERFALNVILKAKEDPIGTGVDAIDDDSDVPIKFIYQDKMFIRYRGVIYDATGKRVGGINK